MKSDDHYPGTVGSLFGLAVTMLLLLAFPVDAIASACSNESLRSETNSLLLPRCRAYEMVAPVYKEGYPIIPVSYAAGGEQAIVYSFGDLVDDPGSGQAPPAAELYLDTRTPHGWQLSPLNPPASQFVGQIAVGRGQEADSGETLWDMHTLSQSAESRDLYVRSASGIFTLVGPLNLPPLKEEEASNALNTLETRVDKVAAATSDYSHIVLYAVQPQDYWPFDGTRGGEGSLYEYSGTDNSEPILVGAVGEKGSRSLMAPCGTILGGTGSVYNALSADGEIIYFTGYPCGAPVEIYARRHGSLNNTTAAETIDISASDCTEACGEQSSGKNFEGASENGERVFFTSTQKLTNNAINGTSSGDATEEEGCQGIPLGAGGCTLYEYTFNAASDNNRLTAIAAGEVLGVAAIDESGTRIYFVSRADIAPENRYGRLAQKGQDNLYEYDTITRKANFIATLSEADTVDWQKAFRRPVEVTGSEGQFLLFASSTPGLVPDDTSTQTQLFEYDATNQELVRITQGEDGYADDGNSVTAPVTLGALVESSERLGYGLDMKSTTNRLNISRNGQSVFFETSGQLSPRASSAYVGCRSVYEFYTPSSTLTEGAVHLISDGRDTKTYKGSFCGAQLSEIDAEGNNVLFTTDDPLTPTDTDNTQRDVYDARKEGGFALAPEGKAGVCGLSSCEGLASRPLGSPVPPSTTELGEARTLIPHHLPRSKKHGRRLKGRKRTRKKAKKIRRPSIGRGVDR